uniref:Si:ch211-210c8.7 n=1 Tax=Myripristis murdjan TaxID=586833 RepID=A0A667Y9U5_9TELE
MTFFLSFFCPPGNGHSQSSVISHLKTVFFVFPVVIALVLLTIAVLGFLLYRYLCHNKGDYRTTGEPGPGEEFNEDYNDQATSEKKEYFI